MYNIYLGKNYKSYWLKEPKWKLFFNILFKKKEIYKNVKKFLEKDNDGMQFFFFFETLIV